jgi:hypothetical protein
MRDANDIPVQCLQKTNADPVHDDLFGESDKWDNFVRIKWKFYVRYCVQEGLTQSMDLAERVKAYVFYGTYRFVRIVRKERKTQIKPVLHAIHNILTQYRCRFVKHVEDRFETFIDLIQKNPEWKNFFDDLGVGNVPLAYLVAIEEGLRSYCFTSSSTLTMGIRKVTSSNMWGTQVKPWRKMEAYITVIRYIRERVSNTHPLPHVLIVSYISYVHRSRTTGGWTSLLMISKNGTSCPSLSKTDIYRCLMDKTTLKVNCPIHRNG